jgi:hypothetical protein
MVGDRKAAVKTAARSKTDARIDEIGSDTSLADGGDARRLWGERSAR